MKRLRIALLCALLLAGCGRQPYAPAVRGPAAPGATSLADARNGFATKLVRKEAQREPVPAPPPQLFHTVRYDSPAGKLAAYLSQVPADGKKRPAIVWIFGGFGNDIGDTAWKEGPPSNDQSAAAFRKAGVVMMYPSFRGGNDNPGFQEGFYGEVDDVLAAADYLAKQDFVDPKRIYLGGHSTGGTLALLAAESTDRFRAVFAFGPVEDVAGYGAQNLPFDLSDKRELELRAPGRWLASIRDPVFVFEGTERPGNLRSLQTLAGLSSNPLVYFYPVKGASHFSTLAPVTRLIAGKIVGDDGPTTDITFTEEELDRLFGK